MVPPPARVLAKADLRVLLPKKETGKAAPQRLHHPGSVWARASQPVPQLKVTQEDSPEAPQVRKARQKAVALRKAAPVAAAKAPRTKEAAEADRLRRVLLKEGAKKYKTVKRHCGYYSHSAFLFSRLLVQTLAGPAEAASPFAWAALLPAAHFACLVIAEGFMYFLFGIHHKWSVRYHRLIKRLGMAEENVAILLRLYL